MTIEKEIGARAEPALETTDQDDWDMQRLGKAQQLKVCDPLRGRVERED